MLKIIAIMLIILGFSFVGWVVRAHYLSRKKFFSSFLLFIDKISIEINFSKDKLLEILKKSEKDIDKNLKKVISNYTVFILERKTDYSKDDLFKGIQYLKEDEKDLLFSFFTSIGHHDPLGERKTIESFRSSFLVLKDRAELDYSKYGPMSLKLGIIFGLGVSILFL